MSLTLVRTEQAPETLAVDAREPHVLIEEGTGGPERGTTLVDIQRNATLIYALNLRPTRDFRRSLRFRIAEGASVQILGLVLGTGDRSLDLSITTDHQGKESVGKVNVRTLLTGSARARLRGMIAIAKSANRSDGFLEGRTILLSPDARAEMIPSLEIEARDVRASHAATTSPIDHEQLQYLVMRGIPPEQARSMILQGFFDDLLFRLPESEERERLRNEWHERFNNEL